MTLYASTKSLVLNILRRGSPLKAVQITDAEELSEPQLIEKMMIKVENERIVWEYVEDMALNLGDTYCIVI